MCEQCLTNPISFGEPLPGYTLMRARRDGDEWKKGEWGIVEVNDPSFRWTITPTPCPVWGMTDEEEEAWFDARTDQDDPEKDRACYRGGIGDFEKAFNCRPESGYDLIKAAIEKGYDPDTSGSFTYWFFDYLGEYLKTAEIREEGDPFPQLEAIKPSDLTIGKD